MKAVSQTIQAIRAALKESAPLGTTPKAAADYAGFCAQAEQRLETVLMMLDKGSDHQALQVAEEEPALLDLVGALSFGAEKPWLAFCEKHGLPAAPLLNARAVRDLEALYAKGISATHPLYKDFRAAVLSRDDDRALKIVRTIVKLNAGDENAKQELQRLENKRLQETVELLRAALKTDDEERIASLTETLKATAPEAKLERIDAYQEGEAIRVSLRRRQARDKFPALMAEMTALQKAGKWRELGALLEKTQGWMKEHGIQAGDNGSQAGGMAQLTEYFQREKTVDDKRQQFERSLKGFLAFVEDVERRVLPGTAATTAEEIGAKDDKFLHHWQELQAFHLPVPDATLQRLKAAGQGLRARLDGMHRARRMRRVALAAAAVVLVLALSAVGAHAWKARTLMQELAAHQTQGRCGPAEELVRSLRGGGGGGALLLRWPYLQAKTVEVEAWTTQARAAEAQAAEALLALEQSFDGRKAALPPPQVVKQMAEASTQVERVVADLAPALKERLAELRKRTGLQLEASQQQLKGSTTTTLAELEQMAQEKLSHGRIAAHAAELWTDIDKKLAALELLLKPETEALTLPVELASRIKVLRRRLVDFNEDIAGFRKVREATAAARTLEDYKLALAEWKNVRFVEAAPALKMLEVFPTEEMFHAALLTGGDQEMLKAVLTDVSGRHMSPGAPLDLDKTLILSLMTDTRLNDIWETTMSYHGGGRGQATIWSEGKPKSMSLGSSIRWTGTFYDPQASKFAAAFTKRDYTRVGEPGEYQGEEVLSFRLSQTSEFMNLLQIKRMTDEDGTRIQRPLLEVFDSLVRDTTCSPVAKAYVMAKLERMAALRPYAWGMHLVPTLQADLRQLHAVVNDTPLQSEDWLVPAMRDKWTAPLAAFFKSCGNRAYMKEAGARREFLREAGQAGLKFGGYVETDLSLVLNQGGRSAGELWVVSKDTGKPLLVANPAAGQAATDTVTPIKATNGLPLSPVFFVPLDRKQLLQRYAETLHAPGKIQPQLGEALLLTAPSL